MFISALSILFFGLFVFAEPQTEPVIEKIKRIKKQEEQKRINELKKVFLSEEKEVKKIPYKKDFNFPSKKNDQLLKKFAYQSESLKEKQELFEKNAKKQLNQSYFNYEKDNLEDQKIEFLHSEKESDIPKEKDPSHLAIFSQRFEYLKEKDLEDQKNEIHQTNVGYLNYIKNFTQDQDSQVQTMEAPIEPLLKNKNNFSLIHFLNSYRSEMSEQISQIKNTELSFFDYVFGKKWFKKALSLPETAVYEEVSREFTRYLLEENKIDFIFEDLKPYFYKINENSAYSYFDERNRQIMHLSVLKDYLNKQDRSHILTTGQIMETLNYTTRNRCNYKRILLAKQNDLWKGLNYSERALYINHLISKYTDYYPVPRDLLMCVISRESHNLTPSLVNFTRCGNKSSTAVGLTQITINTLRHLYQLKKYSLVKGFESETSPFRVHDLFIIYPELQIERSMAILTYLKINKRQRYQLRKMKSYSESAKNIYKQMLYNYYSHPCKARNQNYTNKVLSCYTCLHKKRKKFQTCLRKSIDSFTESKVLKKACNVKK